MNIIPLLTVVLLIVFARLLRFRTMFYKRLYRLWKPNPELPKTYVLEAVYAPTVSMNYEQRVPKLIHQTMASRSLPIDLYETCMINRHMNPEYEYRTYANADFETIAREYSPDAVRALKMLLPGAFKSDLTRCLLLYMRGGVYIDTKATTMKPLRELLRPDTRMLAFVDYTPNSIHNGFAACEPGHPLMKDIIDRIIRNTLKHQYGECQLDITGPMVWGRVFNARRGKHELTEFEAGEYTDVSLVGTYLNLPQSEYLFGSDGVPYINRIIPTAYSIKRFLNPDHYAVRYYSRRVFDLSV
jgi:Glycosyltransferase sugar-binding region containing DXD motif